MKELLKYGIIFAVVGIVITMIISPNAKGTNIKVKSENESMVYFYPVCPECDHVSELYSVNISKGEEHKTAHMCEKCFEVYDVEIKR